ncbi:MAG: hypothetical protein VSS75_012855 [Candidatus Parabeggiatoa sp.]|nr:hypothetical protein [Candidatus Parabeggiatoa sp.]
MPTFMKHKGIGKKLISIIYDVAKQFGYELFLVDLTQSFHDRLINRGAVQCEDDDIVQITDFTRLI